MLSSPREVLKDPASPADVFLGGGAVARPQGGAMAAEIRICLRRKQRESLERKRRADADPRVVRRATIVLMSDEGYPVEDICAATGVCPGTVTNTRRRWLAEGFRGLSDKPRPGRPPIADGEYIAELLGAVSVSPLRWGYEFSVWTTATLGEHLRRRLGKRLCPETVGDLLRGCGYVWGRPKHTLEGKRDEGEHRRARRRLARLKRGRVVETPGTRSSSSTRRPSTSTRTWLGAGDVAEAS